jgi:hypothetical protein
MKLFNIFNWVQNLVEAFTFYSGGGGGGQTSTGTTYTSNLPEYAKPFFEQALVSAGKNVFETDAEVQLQVLNQCLLIQATELQGLLQVKKRYKET